MTIYPQSLYTKRYREKLKQLITRGKDRPCVDCNIKFTSDRMEYDHREPKHKLFKISGSLKSFGWSTIQLEMGN